MKFKPVSKLPNMEDISSEIIKKRNNILHDLESLANLYGYDQIETPIIEETELFIRKSGGELSNKLYSFMEPGGINVSLRPEFTYSLARVANKKIKESKNLRFYYNGPVFRYSSPDDKYGGKSRQYTQFGAELFGSKSIHSDAEILAMSIKGLEKVGINKPKICLFNMQIINDLLSHFNISDRSKFFLIKNVYEIKLLPKNSIIAKAKSIGIIKDKKNIQNSNSNSKDLIKGHTGRRTKIDIKNRIEIQKKLIDEKNTFLLALDFVKKIYKISGTQKVALRKFTKLLQSYNFKFKNHVKYFENLFYSLDIQDINTSNIILDFGLSKSIAYYNGIIFDIFPNTKSNESIVTGGRYDDLNKILGYRNNLPALGFAYNIDLITSLVNQKNENIKEKIYKQSKSKNIKKIIKDSNLARESGSRSFVEYIN